WTRKTKSSSTAWCRQVMRPHTAIATPLTESADANRASRFNETASSLRDCESPEKTPRFSTGVAKPGSVLPQIGQRSRPDFVPSYGLLVLHSRPFLLFSLEKS